MTTDNTQAAFALLDIATSQITTADSLSELVDQLIDGHRAVEADDRVALRADALAQGAARASALILAGMGDDVSALSEDALTLLLHDRSAEVPEFSEWDSNVPLFLMATNYAPYTDLTAPAGELIVWLNPHTERAFLDSLSALGIAELMVHTDA
jgi:hypothetical protein